MPATEGGTGAEEAAGSVLSGKALHKLLDAYAKHFDIALNYTFLGTALPAMASFHSRGEKFLFTKKARIWALECNEHALFFTPPSFDEAEFQKITELLISAEAELAKPHPEHMYTYLSAVVLTENAHKDALFLVRRYKWRKYYRFTLQGWCHIRIAVLDLANGTFTTNRDGEEMRDALSAVLGGAKAPVRAKF